MGEHDTGYAPESWEFDSEVTKVFDDMLARSIPQYDVMRGACTDIARRYAKDNTDIVDLGCSRGGAIEPILKARGCRNRFVGCECSQPMLEAARERFKGYIDNGTVDIRSLDLREDYPVCSASVTMAVLTIQFVPIEYRQSIIQSVYQSTIEGGAFIMVEKILGSCGDTDRMLVDIYLNSKREKGYTEEQIQRKKLSLEGRLVPVTAQWNEDMLSKAGFRHIECFWRWMNFAGWVAIK